MSRFAARPTPAEFEVAVEEIIRRTGVGLTDFTVTRSEDLQGTDGCYEIDVTARFTAFGGASFVMLVECKRYEDPIKREKVQVLRDKLQSIGAHKGMMVSTSTFQSGAIEYAEKHGIALVQMLSGGFNYLARNLGGGPRPNLGFMFGLARLTAEGKAALLHLETPEARQRLKALLS